MSVTSRRWRTIPGLMVGAVAAILLVPLWLPLAALFDVARLRFRLPTVRLLAFGVWWAWLEVAGVAASAFLWATGLAGDRRRHYALQRWWAAQLMTALRRTTGLEIDDSQATALRPGPAILLCRHASLADSLVSAWIVTTGARMNPRYVLKRELLLDPCLDIVGNRLPNHFLDRESTDSKLELDALRLLAEGMGGDDVAIIFPEGTRATPSKRSRALAKIEERDPERAERLRPLRHVLPPRPAGTQALLDGCPQADLVFAWHAGFDGLDNFAAILRRLAHHPAPVPFATRRVPRSEVPAGDEFTEWLDRMWLEVDDSVDELLADRPARDRMHPDEHLHDAHRHDTSPGGTT